mgnify:CR=1 FL=1
MNFEGFKVQFCLNYTPRGQNKKDLSIIEFRKD